jgi:hypothetical protein
MKDSAIERERGFGAERVGRSRARQTTGRRRSYFMTTGDTPATMHSGGGCRHTVRQRYRKRERKRRGPGGPVAHREAFELEGKAGGGRTAAPWPTEVAAVAEGNGSPAVMETVSDRFLQQRGSRKRGEAPGVLGRARGGRKWRDKPAAGARVSG